jgi:hypothetical protein
MVVKRSPDDHGLSPAAEGERNRGADLVDTLLVEAYQKLPEARFRDGNDVVEIDRARIFHPIISAEHDFGCHASDRGGYWRN